MLSNPLPATCRTYSTHRTDTASYPADWQTHQLVKMGQPHGDQILGIDSPDDPTLLTSDGCLTSQPGLHLQVKTADCLPILLYHPKPVIGAIHAGRKSTQQQILSKVCQLLQEKFAIFDQLALWFGPAICVDCYQVDREMDLHYNLIAENTKQLRQFFSKEQATIFNSDLCTAHHNDQFFSYRQEGPQVPRNFSGIVLE
ncbi:MAG: polyphenol oxidase family protein [Patescibacteria group bacterium]